MRSKPSQLSLPGEQTVALAGDCEAFPAPLGGFAADLEAVLGWRLAAAAGPGLDTVPMPDDLRASLTLVPEARDLCALPRLDLIIVAGEDPEVLSRVRAQAPRSVGVMDLISVLRLMDTLDL